MEEMNTNNSNIINQLASYNSSDLENYIYNLKNIYSEQETLNKVLNENEVAENIEYINNFLLRNKDNIKWQLEEVKNITQNIYEICLKNESIEKEKEEYINLINSTECKEIAYNLNEIQKIKNEMKNFLSKKGLFAI